MKIQNATRKPFGVKAVQVNLDNIEEVAEWCKGTIVQVPVKMMGTTTDLPAIRIKGQGDNRTQDFVASLGCWIVELKGGYRSYKPATFSASFDVEADVQDTDEDVQGDHIDIYENTVVEAS